MSKLKDRITSIRIKILLKNLYSLFRYDLKKELRRTQRELIETQEELSKMKQDILFYKLMNYYANNSSPKYAEEISYLKELGCITVFPYKQLKVVENVVAEFDNKRGMPYVIHKNKSLYFPKSWSVEDAKMTYISYIQGENILGGNYSAKSPHQYQTQDFCVKEGDVVLDIGSAEALFSLDVIEIAQKIYIFESEESWIEPLNATFEPYQDKVQIFNKLVSDKDSGNEVKLESCLDMNEVKSLFVKMDIEGYEKLVLEGNKELLLKNIDIRIACCTYHKQNDSVDLKLLFENFGYKTEYSDGYMIFLYDKELSPPYFRNGLIRAHKSFN